MESCHKVIKPMKRIALLSILLAISPAHAQIPVFFGGNPRDTPQSVPEPSNPFVLLTAAGAILLMRRKRN